MLKPFQHAIIYMQMVDLENKNMLKEIKNNAFTLAEVLITLGIIGVVAALTIPTLMNNSQDQQYKTAYKKAYSIASQAWIQGANNGDIIARPSWTDGATRAGNFNGFKQYFKVAVDCSPGNLSKCWDTSGEVYFGTGGCPTSTAPAFIDASGMAWTICADSTNNGWGPDMEVDTNGLKKPNKYGQDRFVFAPMDASGTGLGLPVKLIPLSDCLSTSNCAADANGWGYDLFCPSVASHPCYFTSWITGGN